MDNFSLFLIIFSPVLIGIALIAGIIIGETTHYKQKKEFNSLVRLCSKTYGMPFTQKLINNMCEQKIVGKSANEFLSNFLHTGGKV